MERPITDFGFDLADGDEFEITEEDRFDELTDIAEARMLSWAMDKVL